MKYDVILIDAFNLYYRKKNDKNLELTALEQAGNCVRYIDNEVLLHLNENGKVYLLFDPIIKTDFGFNKKFKYTSVRREIDPGYKANRHHSIEVQEANRQIMNYYSYREDKFAVVMDPNLEADDFVEQILEREQQKWEKAGNTRPCEFALYTTDHDWMRYLDPHCVVIHKGWEEPYTWAEYKDKYGYTPTPASVAIDKALFGDKSDNIDGAITSPKIKLLIENADKLGKQLVVDVANSRETLKEFVARFSQYVPNKVSAKKEKTTEEEVYLLLRSSISRVDALTQFHDNLRLVKSRCKDVREYITKGKDDPKMRLIVEKCLGISKSGQKFKFGNMRVQ